VSRADENIFHANAAMTTDKDDTARELRLTVLGTADIHGYLHNWDYFTDGTYRDTAGNAVGLAKIATLVRQIRAEPESGATLTIDAGDTIQGTPLAYLYRYGAASGGQPIADRQPGHADARPVASGHPIAAAMNAIGYDAAAIGNHEFNYGLGALHGFRAQLDFPLLAANAFDWDTGEPAFDQFILKRLEIGPSAITVGLVGFVTPGCAIWDRAHLEGRIRFTGIVESGAEVIPKVLAAGADVVIVASHSGADTSSSYGDALPWPENASALLAEEVPGIAAILVGHAHTEIGQRFVTNRQTGRQVLLTEPSRWAQRLSVIELTLRQVPENRWQVASSTSKLLDTRDVAEDPTVRSAIHDAHEHTWDYTNSVIGTATDSMSLREATYRYSPALTFVNHVQASTVKAALRGTEYAGLPVLASTSPFSKNAGIPAGPVTVRDVAGLYPFDNSLLGLLITGAQLRDYLEFAARYYRQVDRATMAGPIAAAELTNAATELAPYGTPDYNFDVVSGIDAALTYTFNLAAEIGARLAELRYDGASIADDERFVLAVNNYRASGGGNYPAVREAAVVYDGQPEIRQLVIDWVSEHQVVDAADYSRADWALTVDNRPLTVID
jgi:2',3'-cyclic-nucleotide 2'-phosphodiesterase / 3'-nucleotidase